MGNFGTAPLQLSLSLGYPRLHCSQIFLNNIQLTHTSLNWLIATNLFFFLLTKICWDLCDLLPSVCPAIYILGSIYQAIKAVLWSLHEAKERDRVVLDFLMEASFLVQYSIQLVEKDFEQLWYGTPITISRICKLQLKAIKKRSNIVRYCINNCRNLGRISIRCWVHKKTIHTLP